VTADFASIFGRHEFVIRRIHSLLGLIPIGGFLIFHLATNASILDSAQIFQERVDIIHGLGPTTLFFLEWSFIFLPIFFHGVVGLIIVTRGARNVAHYPYAGNIRYTLQRATGVIAFLFILWHVFHMHGWLKFEWWVTYVAAPLGGAKFDPDDVATAAAAIQASTIVFVLYAVGIISSVYHLANGLWTMGITWGLWTSPRAQRWANIPCAAFGLVLAVIGLGALVGMAATDTSGQPAEPTVRVGAVNPPLPVVMHSPPCERLPAKRVTQSEDGNCGRACIATKNTKKHERTKCTRSSMSILIFVRFCAFCGHSGDGVVTLSS
jgi:succinate dehydrogenase / fumarate reductase cytochrome b subunit